jgi:hypothetical protein
MPSQQAKPQEIKDTDTSTLERKARSISQDIGQPAIYIARMGLDGSSGHHAHRRTKLELHVTNAAIDAIKRRHAFTSFNMVGQSGGSTLIGSLLALRNDINCAVPGAGRLQAKAESIRRNRLKSDPAMLIINPSDGISNIVRASTAKIMVVTDPEDQRVTREHQDPFVQALRNAGRQIEQFYVSADDPLHHGVSRFAFVVARECVRGTAPGQIARLLADPVPKAGPIEPAPQPTDRARTPPAPPRVVTPSPTPMPVPRHTQPQDPSRSLPSAAEPIESQRQCQRYLPLIGRNVIVPCDPTQETRPRDIARSGLLGGG